MQSRSQATSTEPLDVHGLRRVIEDRISRPDDSPPSDETRPKQEPPAGQHPTFGIKRYAKIAAGVLIVAVFGWIPLQTVLQSSSVQAVINSRVVTLRAPIDGEVSAPDAALLEAKVVPHGTLVLRIVNPRADRGRLDELRRQLARLESEQPALLAKLISAEAAQKDLAQQASRFTQGRIRQLEARIAELRSLIEVAGARKEEAAAAVERAASLSRSGSVSAVESARLARERTIAEQTEIGARRRLDASEVELTAAREGTFLGDSYNDRPSSVQREEEMRQRLDQLNADLATTNAELLWLRREVASQEARYASLSEAAVLLPVSGRIWEMMTSPGEDVRAGQPLLRVLDCSGAVVTANVTESVYNRLKVGAKAQFRPADGGPDLDGTVLNLTGAAGAAANLAINPDALSKEPYRVTVSVPKLKEAANDCAVGRTGRVIFSGEAARSP
ncbi:MAG: HlyD family efflux transporter periplasmic adaptor subunit [Xanthobacteraceae bacterium]|nr:HlyD family efflux transporter periplasmic adaptor subunit [Xanthobacteraceae bacterium]